MDANNARRCIEIQEATRSCAERARAVLQDRLACEVLRSKARSRIDDNSSLKIFQDVLPLLREEDWLMLEAPLPQFRGVSRCASKLDCQD